MSLPPKMLRCRAAASTSTTCLRESCIQSAAFLPPLSTATARGRTPQRSAMTSFSVSGAREAQALVDVVEDEAPVLGGHVRDRALDARVGRADARARPHRDDEEEAAVVGEEGEHAAVRREAVDDEVDALREDVAVRGLHGRPARSSRRRTGPPALRRTRERIVISRAAGDVSRARDPHAVLAARRPERLDVVGGDAAVVEGAANEVEDEARVVVVQVRVGVLEAAVAAGQVDDGLLARDRRAAAGGAAPW